MKMIHALLLLSVVAMSARGTCVAEDAERKMPAKQTFLVIYRPGPAWPHGARVSALPLKEHGRYMLELFRKGSMKFAGPLTDDTGGAVVLTVADAAEAEAIVAADPAVRSGIFLQEIHPWQLVPWAEHAERQKAMERGKRTP